MKNCEVALCRSLVRAIASVPRWFLRPFSASFLIGARVGFCSISAVEAAALDHEARDHAVEDRAVVEALVHVAQEVLRGDRRRLLVDLDGEVAVGGFERTIGFSSAMGADSNRLSRPRAFRHALVAREVRGSVSTAAEARGAAQGAAPPAPWRGAVLEQQAPAGRAGALPRRPRWREAPPRPSGPATSATRGSCASAASAGSPSATYGGFETIASKRAPATGAYQSPVEEPQVRERRGARRSAARPRAPPARRSVARHGRVAPLATRWRSRRRRCPCRGRARPAAAGRDGARARARPGAPSRAAARARPA